MNESVLGKFQNETEEFVFRICRGTFLSLWSYANPLGKNGKELCDILIVCGPDVVVISVKHVELSENADPEVALRRWLRKAVTKSVDQVYGAVRWLDGAARVIRHDGAEGLPLPPRAVRRVHRVSVSLGSAGAAPIPSGDFGKGFVHVFNEASFMIIMEALNTISDFVEYLTTKEELVVRCPDLVVEGEENLPALYLRLGRAFPDGCPDGVIETGLWEQLLGDPAFQRKLDEDKASYVWDALLDHFGEHAIAGTLEIGNELDSSELAFRELALETRFGRRVLGAWLREFFELARAGELRARMCRSPRDGVGYVFLNARAEDSREWRGTELEMRCFIARGDLGRETIIGLCVNVEPAEEGHCEEVLLLRMPEWSEENQKEADKLKTDLGFFANPIMREDHIEEYPPE